MKNITTVLVIYCTAASFFLFGKKDEAGQATKTTENCPVEKQAATGGTVQTSGADGAICLLAMRQNP